MSSIDLLIYIVDESEVTTRKRVFVKAFIVRAA